MGCGGHRAKTNLSERVANAEFTVRQIEGFEGSRWTKGSHRWLSSGQALRPAVAGFEVLWVSEEVVW
jgi:hypothetical protein